MQDLMALRLQDLCPHWSQTEFLPYKKCHKLGHNLWVRIAIKTRAWPDRHFLTGYQFQIFEVNICWIQIQISTLACILLTAQRIFDKIKKKRSQTKQCYVFIQEFMPALSGSLGTAAVQEASGQAPGTVMVKPWSIYSEPRVLGEQLINVLSWRQITLQTSPQLVQTNLAAKTPCSAAWVTSCLGRPTE